MDDSRIGRRYAQALYSTAAKYDMVASVESDLNALANQLERDQSFRDFLLAPYTSRDEKAAILDKLFSDRMTALTMQVLRVMLEKRREHEITAVQEEFVALRREAQGIVHAVVASAEALPDDQRKALIKKLEASIGKTVEAEYRVDPRLIGGVRVTYGTYVLDGTIKGALSQLRERLRHDLLKQQG